MQSHAFAASAYAQHSASVSSPRGIEYKAFNRVTAQLNAALEDGVPFYKLAEAIHLNTRLWATLAADLLSERNELPMELRAQLFSLAEYSRRCGLKCLTGKADPRELIEINTMIMRGLRETQGAAAETEAAAADTDAPRSAIAASGRV